MSIANILVHVEPGPASEARLAYALAMATKHDAMLTGLSVRVPPTEVAFAMMGDAQLYAVAAEAAAESSRAAKAQFDTKTANCGLATQWYAADGVPEEVMCARAGAYDVVIVGRGGRSDLEAGFYSLEPADVILGCGRPVVVLPDEAPRTFTSDRVLIAWRNTPEAARALHDSMPFLREANDVVLAEIVSDEAAPSTFAVTLEEAAEHLKAHCVPARIRRLKAEDAATGMCLIGVAEEMRADLIVAGAYGHSRFREWVLGGVTRSLLSEGSYPCLLSH